MICKCKEQIRHNYHPPEVGWRVHGNPIIATFVEEVGNLRITHTHTHRHRSVLARLAEATSGCTFRCVSVWFACVQGHGTESIAVGAGGHGIARASNVQLRNEILQRRCGCSRLLYCMLQHARFSCKVVHGAPTMLPRHVMATWGDDIVEDVATHLKSVQLAGPVRLSKLTHVCRTSTPTRFGVAILSGWACFGNLPVSPSNRPSGLQHRRQ